MWRRMTWIRMSCFKPRAIEHDELDHLFESSVKAMPAR